MKFRITGKPHSRSGNLLRLVAMRNALLSLTWRACSFSSFPESCYKGKGRRTRSDHLFFKASQHAVPGKKLQWIDFDTAGKSCCLYTRKMNNRINVHGSGHVQNRLPRFVDDLVTTWTRQSWEHAIVYRELRRLRGRFPKMRRSQERRTNTLVSDSSFVPDKRLKTFHRL